MLFFELFDHAAVISIKYHEALWAVVLLTFALEEVLVLCLDFWVTTSHTKHTIHDTLVFPFYDFYCIVAQFACYLGAINAKLLDGIAAVVRQTKDRLIAPRTAYSLL